MSLRRAIISTLRYGRSLLDVHGSVRGATYTNIIISTVNQNLGSSSSVQQVCRYSSPFRTVGLYLKTHARKILIDNILNRVTNTLAADLKKKTSRRLLFGDSGPFFALVGVSLASGTGILTKQDELEGVCWEIRNTTAKVMDWYHNQLNDVHGISEDSRLNSFDLGQPINKGANGVTYSARLNGDDFTSCCEDDNSYPLAIKMLFNYDVESNSTAILKAMCKETITALQYNDVDNGDALNLFPEMRRLPPHPNIAPVLCAFSDRIGDFCGAKMLFPDALPVRLNPEGYGRNMSLFLVMQRYQCNLEQFLRTNGTNLPVRISIALLAQLLEGVTHLNQNQIAHRDLKSDNVLVDCSDSHMPVLKISDFGCCLADKHYGLRIPYCTSDVEKGGNTALMAPEIINQQPGPFATLNYTKADLWAVGAIAYELFGSKNPFYKPTVDSQCYLHNAKYTIDQLPLFDRDDIPAVIEKLIRNLLQPSSSKRVAAETAANICQLYLWAPSAWQKASRKLPTDSEILQWLLSLTTKLLCEISPSKRASSVPDFKNTYGRRTQADYILISCFLSRVKLSAVRRALQWMHSDM